MTMDDANSKSNGEIPEIEVSEPLVPASKKNKPNIAIDVDLANAPRDQTDGAAPIPRIVAKDVVASLTSIDDEEQDRASWGGKLEFLFTCIGYAVGLGNVWRFPYLAYKNGGGAFLVPYILMLALVGLPLFFMELAYGQFASLGPITIWKMNPLLKGLGYAMVSVSWLIGVYYNVIISHVMLYLFASIASIGSDLLPWVTCDNWWNTENCLRPVYRTEEGNATLNASTGVLDNNLGDIVAGLNVTRNFTKTPAEEYYNHFVLEISESIDVGGGINWKLALCLLLCWLIVMVALIKGIASLGKVVYFTALFPYVMLTILLIRGCSLPGAGQGIRYYLTPDWSRLADSRVWCDAATQIFFSLSTCTGGLIAMSSYNKFHSNCYRDSLIVALINCATSIYSGFVIFAVLGFMAAEKGVDVSDVAAGGPGLAFVVYPEALSRMPVPQLWAIFFFIMMATLGFGSQFSIVEAVLSAFSDEFNAHLRKKWHSIAFRCAIIIFTFFCGLPMVSRGGIYILNLVDYSVSGFPLLVIGVLEIIALNWCYGYTRFSEDIEMMIGHKPNIYWKVCWLGLTPAVILITVGLNMIFYKPPSYDGVDYPGWAQGLGWVIGFSPIMLIIIFFLYRYCYNGGYLLMKELGRPHKDWGPALLEYRSGRYAPDEPLTPMSVGVGGEYNFYFHARHRLDITTILRARSNMNLAQQLPIFPQPAPAEVPRHLKLMNLFKTRSDSLRVPGVSRDSSKEDVSKSMTNLPSDDSEAARSLRDSIRLAGSSPSMTDETNV